MRHLILMTALVMGACNVPSGPAPSDATTDADVVIVGAGISGISAVLEAARGGASVLVVDTRSCRMAGFASWIRPCRKPKA